MDTITITQTDTSSAITATLLGVDGKPQDLTSATVTLSLWNGADLKLDAGACTVLDALKGRVRYTLLTADVATPGRFRGKFKVSFLAGPTLHFPNNGHFVLVVLPESA